MSLATSAFLATTPSLANGASRTKWLGVEHAEDALRRGEADHAPMQNNPEFPQRPEHFDAEHQDDEQGGKFRLASHDPVGPPAQGHGGADPDPGVRNAA